MSETKKLTDLAKVIRSKNAGPDKITFDVILKDRASFDLVCGSGVLSREAVGRLYGVPDGRISDHVTFEPALAIKFTLFRTIPAAALGTPTSLEASNTGPCSGSRCRFNVCCIPVPLNWLATTVRGARLRRARMQT